MGGLTHLDLSFNFDLNLFFSEHWKFPNRSLLSYSSIGMILTMPTQLIRYDCCQYD
jgi:hypothetical protein